MREQLLRSEPVFNRTLAGLLVVLVASMGVLVVVASRAANFQMYLSPAVVAITQGSDFNVSVRVNSGTDPVNAVEADISYDATKVQYVSVSATGSDFPLVAATNTATSGKVLLARAISPGTPTVVGDGLVAIVTFHALANAGTSDITVANSSALVRSTDNTNILIDSAGSTVSFNTPGSPTPTPSATPTPTPTPSPTPAPAPSDSATLSLSPASGSVGTGGDLSVQVHEDSGSAPVNAVQANFSYPANLLDVTSVDETASAFGLNASTSATGGNIQIARGTNPGTPAVTGSQLVATIKFRAKTTADSAVVTGAGGSAVVRAADSADILSNTAGGTYTVTVTQPSATPTPTPTPTPTATPVPTPTPTPTPKPKVVVVNSSNRKPPTLSGTVSFKAPTLAHSDQPVTYQIDNVPVDSSTVDTSTLNDGEHVVTATTGTGTNQKSVKQEVTVSNTVTPLQRLVAGVQTNGPTIGIAVALLVVIVVGIGLARKLIVTSSPANRAIGGHGQV